MPQCVAGRYTCGTRSACIGELDGGNLAWRETDYGLKLKSDENVLLKVKVTTFQGLAGKFKLPAACTLRNRAGAEARLILWDLSARGVWVKTQTYQSCPRKKLPSLRFVESHPSRKNKNAARVGHTVSCSVGGLRRWTTVTKQRPINSPAMFQADDGSVRFRRSEFEDGVFDCEADVAVGFCEAADCFRLVDFGF